MSIPAAFRATYSDWRLVRSRKVVQIVLEVPLEGSSEAYDVLGGMPNPAAETWCAIARLDHQRTEDTIAPASAHGTQRTQQPASERPSHPNPAPVRALRNYPQQAGIYSSKPAFWKFAQERDHPEVVDADTAADYIRMYCGIETRKQIQPGTQAEQRWLLLVSAFMAWERAPACGIVA
jgi:hypothetical protein